MRLVHRLKWPNKCSCLHICSIRGPKTLNWCKMYQVGNLLISNNAFLQKMNPRQIIIMLTTSTARMHLPITHQIWATHLIFKAQYLTMAPLTRTWERRHKRSSMKMPLPPHLSMRSKVRRHQYTAVISRLRIIKAPISPQRMFLKVPNRPRRAPAASSWISSVTFWTMWKLSSIVSPWAGKRFQNSKMQTAWVKVRTKSLI